MCFNIAKKKKGSCWETFWDSVKFTWDSTFVDALGPRDAIEINHKSNTGYFYLLNVPEGPCKCGDCDFPQIT